MDKIPARAGNCGDEHDGYRADDGRPGFFTELLHSLLFQKAAAGYSVAFFTPPLYNIVKRPQNKSPTAFFTRSLPFFFRYLQQRARQKIINGHRTDIAFPAHTDGYCPALRLLVADDEHIRDFLKLRLAYLIADLLAAFIQLHAEARAAQLLINRARRVMVPLGDRQDARLLRRKPQRECPRVFLDEQRKRALVAADGGAVDDIGVLFCAVLVRILHAEFFREHLIDLDGDERILFSVDILDLDIKLRPVESCFAHAHGIIQPQMVEDFLHHALRLGPLLGCADIFFTVVWIPLREAIGYILIQPHRFQHKDGELQAALKFILQLFGRAHQMALGNCELPHTDQSVHLAGGLVAEQRGGLVIAQRQVAVGAGFVEIRLILERAGHRAQGEHLVILLLIAQHEHAVFIV